MPEPFKLTRIPSLKTVADFRQHVASLGLDLPCEDTIATGAASPLAQPVAKVTINHKTIGNRWAIQPMEGWDGTPTGGVTDDVRRRWQRFGESGAKLIYGGEAMAVRPDGRANPNQLIINEANKAGLAEVRDLLLQAHQDRYGQTDDLVLGFQLTHSGRFCKPNDKKRLEPRVAYRHPILDRKFGVTSEAQLFTDAEIESLIACYIAAAKVAWEVGADFVDIKHCHGYLLHEFLSAFTRPGKYGGSFENRTRLLREIVAGIRGSGNPIEMGVRLSAFDFVPFRADPALARPGKLGPGIPEDFSHCLPYRYAFGVDQNHPLQPDLTETFQFAELCAQLGVKLLNLSAGSPYYNPHIQRPAAYPPSDGYQPAHDPLIDVARQINVVRQVKEHIAALPRSSVPAVPGAPAATLQPILIGTAYSYLQEYLPHVAQYVVRHGWTDLIGLGRVTLSYPTILADAVDKGVLATKSICRTFSDCTTAPRNGLISGCYPLDKHYSSKPEFQLLKEIKKAVVFLWMILIWGAAAQSAEPLPPPAAAGTQTPALPDLSAYRTVLTASTTQIVRSAAARAGQSGYLGVHVAPDKRGRLTVEEVDADGPAAQAGVQTGDVLVKVAGRSLKEAEQLRELLQSRAPGEMLPLVVERKRNSLELAATLGATSRPMKIGARRTTLGVRLEDRKQGEGAEVAQITVGSPAARAGLKPGDVLLKLDGELISNHNYVRERLDEKQPGDTIKLAVVRDGEDLEIEARLAAAEMTADFTPRRLWKKDTYRLAVVLVEYADVKHNSHVTTNEWADFTFSTGAYLDKTNVTGQAVYGSVNDYYREISGGAFHFQGRVFDWIEMSRKRAEYAQGTNANNRSIFFTEALDRLLEREGTNALNDFDGLWFLHAGERVNTANRGSLYWPHQGSTTYRGTRWSYFICQEGGRRMTDISTACHEFGHSLGLPDLYARPENPGSEGLGVWCCMSNESGRGRPQHFGAWCKEQLGWLQPAIIDPAVKQKLILAPVANSTNECFKVLVRRDGSEYFLLENRRRIGFDRSLPAEGLLIWRVVNGKPILEESHGIDGPPGPRLFPSAVPYPSRANNAFTPYTTPSSRSLLGGGAPVHITNIRELADGRITFQIGYEFQ